MRIDGKLNQSFFKHFWRCPKILYHEQSKIRTPSQPHIAPPIRDSKPFPEGLVMPPNLRKGVSIKFYGHFVFMDGADKYKEDSSEVKFEQAAVGKFSRA